MRSTLCQEHVPFVPEVKAGDIAISKASGAIFLVHRINGNQFAATVLYGKTTSGYGAGTYHPAFNGYDFLSLYNGVIKLSN